MSRLVLDLDPGLSADAATRTVLRVLFARMQAEEPGVRADTDAEALHDFRVAMRRTRSALSQLQGVFPKGRLKRFRRGFRWLGRETGPQRDADVLEIDLAAYAEELGPGHAAGLEVLREELRDVRKRAFARTLDALDSKRYRKLKKHWSGFLAETPEPGSAPDGERPVRAVSSERIARVHAVVMELGDGLNARSAAADFHALRIDCKKLRYMLTFFKSLYAANEVAELVRALRKLQDALGVYNDCDIQRRNLNELARRLEEHGGDVAGAATTRRIVELLDARQADVREHFEEIWAGFASDDGRLRVDRLFGQPTTDSDEIELL